MDFELRLDEYLAMDEKPDVTYRHEKVEAVIVDRCGVEDEYYIRTESRSYPAMPQTILDVAYDTMVEEIFHPDEAKRKPLVIRSEEVTGVEIVRGEHSIILAATSEGARAILRKKHGKLPPLWSEAGG